MSATTQKPKPWTQPFAVPMPAVLDNRKDDVSGWWAWHALLMRWEREGYELREDGRLEAIAD